MTLLCSVVVIQQQDKPGVGERGGIRKYLWLLSEGLNVKATGDYSLTLRSRRGRETDSFG